MNPKTRTLNEQTLRALAHGYMIFSLLSFFLLWYLGPIPLPCSNAVYYLLMNALVLTEYPTLLSLILRRLILLLIIVYPISLLVSYILALVKKWFRLFGILMAINVLIGLSLLVAVVLINHTAPPFWIAVDVIVNTFYTIYYFRLQKEFAREQAEPALYDANQPEQTP